MFRSLGDSEINQFRVGALGFPEHQDFRQQSELVPIEGTPVGLAFTTRRPVIQNRIDREGFPAEIMRRDSAQGVKSGCSVPLISHEPVLGVLSLGSMRGAFDEGYVEPLGQIGKQVAIAVENAFNFGGSIRGATRTQVRTRSDRNYCWMLPNAVKAILRRPTKSARS
jgi:formate hydrogenlyase transcriptional activator